VTRDWLSHRARQAAGREVEPTRDSPRIALTRDHGGRVASAM